MQTEPLILTILLEEKAHEYFTGLREQHFPKYCNFLEAHLTLFHRLPSNKKKISEVLKEITKKPEMLLDVSAVKSIGNGVAFEIKSAALMQLHQYLQQQFSPRLTTQDRKKLWPHITIQNKVTAYKASQTLAQVQADFKPFSIRSIGIGSWLYKDGPWEKKADYFFCENSTSGAPMSEPPESED